MLTQSSPGAVSQGDKSQAGKSQWCWDVRSCHCCGRESLSGFLCKNLGLFGLRFTIASGGKEASLRFHDTEELMHSLKQCN